MQRNIRAPLRGRASSKVVRLLSKACDGGLVMALVSRSTRTTGYPGQTLEKVLSPMLDINMDAAVDFLIDQDLRC